MKPLTKLYILWAIVLVFLAIFIYGLSAGKISQEFMWGALFAFGVLGLANRFENYRKGLVKEIGE